MTEKVKDMTHGKPAGLIFGFALPLMLGNMFQQLYTVVDTAIVGRFIGVEALASVGASDWPSWMILGAVVGFAQGFCILLSQCFGAGDYDGLRKGMTHIYGLGIGLGLLITLLGQMILRPLLSLLHTPPESMQGALTYGRIIFSGITITMMYNVFSSVLRALGNSRTPLIAMVIAALVNIVLDLLFVRVFCWGIAGAAVATVLAQCIAALFCLFNIGRIEFLHLHREDWKPDGKRMGQLMRLGFPMAFQNGIIGVGGMAVQYAVNSFGVVVLAGFTATNKIYGILELAAISYGFSMSTFAGQNLGAGKYDRIRQGLRAALMMSVLTSAAISVPMILWGRSFLSLFIDAASPSAGEVMRVAYTYLSVMSWTLMILYFLHLYRSALQGMGDTVRPMISGFLELAMRVSTALLLPHLLGENGLYIAEPAAWLGAVSILIPSYYRLIRRLRKRDTARNDNIFEEK